MPDSNGPVMLAATQVMRPGRTRIGKLGGNVTLPRTVPLVSLITGAVGFLLGAVFGLALAGGSITGLMYGGTFGAAGGVFVVTYSPMKGESMLTWFGLTVTSRRRQVKVDGKPVTLFVGVYPIARPPAGPVTIVRGATRIPPSQFDERGVQLSAGNRNLALAVDLDLDGGTGPDVSGGQAATGRGRGMRHRMGRQPQTAQTPPAAAAPGRVGGGGAPAGDPLPADSPGARLAPGGLHRKTARPKADRPKADRPKADRPKTGRPKVSSRPDPAPSAGGDPAMQLPRPRRLKD